MRNGPNGNAKRPILQDFSAKTCFKKRVNTRRQFYFKKDGIRFFQNKTYKFLFPDNLYGNATEIIIFHTQALQESQTER